MAVLDPRGESPDDMAARKELEFDARVALPEAQERYERAEAEVERLTQERDELAVELLDRPGTAKLRAEVERLRERIEKAPHAMHCEAGAGFLPGPCNCWKRDDV